MKNVFNRIGMRIGGAVFGIECADPSRTFLIEDDYRRFLTDERPDVRYVVHYGKTPPKVAARAVFDSQVLWRLLRTRTKNIFKVGFRHEGGFVEQRLAVISRDYKSGDIYMMEDGGGPYLYPWSHPLDEIVAINYLSGNHGALIHSCGVSKMGRGYLFAGVSGAGKSTMARLWMKHRGAKVLSDDRIIVQKSGGNFSIYGTPWHGDAKICWEGSVPLKKLFIIGHGKKNRAEKLRASEVVATLLVRTFAPYWDKYLMERTLETYHALVKKVDAYRLNFVPDGSAIEFIEKL